jgi:hypothetical protein
VSAASPGPITLLVKDFSIDKMADFFWEDDCTDIRVGSFDVKGKRFAIGRDARAKGFFVGPRRTLSVGKRASIEGQLIAEKILADPAAFHCCDTSGS